ncbi:Gly-Xaa-Xaa repeat protein [Bacillus thuringiensis]|uniref:Gly-Xaa-Xaa repeat protein n=1 Tax=Bacillus thuringiensis TaxID=1428 RepID=UPI0022259316|nr:Gly-Xaa-Xaa repeat protein [Bacillus thuringiensis]UYX53912.1 Gly-Xaa-Xaa repeat protein [Bacillus thuringiensis]
MINKNKGKVFYGNDCCEVRACSFINISKSELKEFARLLQALGENIQAVFQNPSQANIGKLIDILNNLQKFLNCLDLSPAQEKIGNSIIANLLTILKTKPFSCGALYVELQILLNYSLYIAKLFKVDCCTIDKLVKLITEIQTILVQYGSGCLGGGATGATGPAGTPIPVTTAVLGNTNAQTVSPGSNIQFNETFELTNISYNGSDTLTVLETGVYDINFSASTTFPGSSPFGFGLSFNGQPPSRNFSTNVIGSAVSFSTIITLTAGTTISVQPTANTISIPNTGETTAVLTVFRIY